MIMSKYRSHFHHQQSEPEPAGELEGKRKQEKTKEEEEDIESKYQHQDEQGDCELQLEIGIGIQVFNTNQQSQQHVRTQLLDLETVDVDDDDDDNDEQHLESSMPTSSSLLYHFGVTSSSPSLSSSTSLDKSQSQSPSSLLCPLFKFHQYESPRSWTSRPRLRLKGKGSRWTVGFVPNNNNNNITLCYNGFNHVWIMALIIMIFTLLIPTCHANPDAKRLYDDLLSNYNRLIRPVSNSTDKVLVRLGLRLSQLIDLNLKDQILTTNVWLEHEWDDHKFQWDPKEYGGVTELYVPSEHIWLPDIVLYNNADGEYVVTTMTKAVLHSSGTVRWTPPAIFKSSCEIDVRYFPFDMQTFMKFGSWSYDGFQIDLKHMNQAPGETQVPVGMDLREYYPSVEWDIISVPAERHEIVYPCCKEPYLDIFFNITLRRRTLFYTVNLIVPTVGISYLSILVFYLPADSGEKIALCISILLSQTMFFLLISEIIPSTSLAVPLLGKYLLFTMFLVGLSVLVTIIVLNIHYRKPSTHKMARWVRFFFTRILPKFLLMRVPEHVLHYNNQTSGGSSNEPTGGPRASPSGSREEGCNGFQGVSRLSGLSLQGFSGFLEQGALEGFPGTPSTSYGLDGPPPDNLRKKLPFEIQKAIHNVEFIQTHMLRQDEFDSEDQDWGFVAMVLDRMFLWLFNLAFFLGTIAILLEAPALYDYSESIDKTISIIAKKQYSPETDI